MLSTGHKAKGSSPQRDKLGHESLTSLPKTRAGNAFLDQRQRVETGTWA